MNESKDCIGEKLQRLEDEMRHKDAEDAKEAEAVTRLDRTYRTILAPVDFSPPSAQALLQAISFTEHFNAFLIVLHVVTTSAHQYAVEQHQRLEGTPICNTVSEPKTLEFPDEIVEEVGHKLREQAHTALRQRLFPHFAGYPLELRVVIGHPVERIIETAVDDEVDLIVLGSHKHTSPMPTALEGVSMSVTCLAPCAVLTVKTATAEEKSWLQDFYETVLP
jgi:nucleotide-binding universal stress UspA family protein